MSAFRFAREAPGRFTRARAACLGSSMAVLSMAVLTRALDVGYAEAVSRASRVSVRVLEQDSE